jgi:hypothetical protein
MTDNPSRGVSSGQEPEPGAGNPRPWFPPAWPSGEPGAVPPGPGPGYGQPGPGYGQPGPGYGYGQPPGPYQPPPHGPWPRPAPKPGVIPLRPLSVSEMLDGAFTSIRRNPRATLGAAAVLLTINAVITTAIALALARAVGPVSLTPRQQLTPGQFSHQVTRLAEVALPVGGVTLLLTFIVDLVLTGLLTVVIARGVLGHQVTGSQAWRLARPRLPALLGVTLLIPAIILGLWLVLALALIVLGAAGAPGAVLGTLAVAGVIAAACLTVWLLIMFRMAAPVVVLERQRVLSSLSRSWRLVRGSFWRVFGITLLAGLIVLVTTVVLEIPFDLLSAVAGGSGSVFATGGAFGGGSTAGVIISAIGGIVAGSVARPVEAGVAVLLYVDLRMRREGLDLALQAAAGQGSATGDDFGSVWRPGGGPAGPGSPPPAR